MVSIFSSYPADIYLFKFDNGNTRTMCEICSILTLRAPRLRRWRPSVVFMVNFEQISHIVIVFSLLTLNNKKVWINLDPFSNVHGSQEQMGFFVFKKLLHHTLIETVSTLIKDKERKSKFKFQNWKFCNWAGTRRLTVIAKTFVLIYFLDLFIPRKISSWFKVSRYKNH